MRQHLTILAAGALLILPGCISGALETSPPKPRYMVGFMEAGALAGESVDWSLIVEDPAASRAYDTTRIAVSPSPGRIEYLADGEWASRAPVVFQTGLIRAFEDSGRILSVGNRAALALSDFALQTDIRRMDLDVSNGAEVARVEVYVRLTNGRGNVVAANAFTANAPARDDDGDDVAAAFDAALQEVIGEVASWTFTEAGGLSGGG